MQLYETWQEGSRSGGFSEAALIDSYNTDPKRITFEWLFRQVNFEAMYNLYRYRFGPDTQSFSKDVPVKITRYLQLF